MQTEEKTIPAQEPQELPIITLDALRKIDDRAPRRIPVPAWGGSVLVREPDVLLDLKIIKSATRKVGEGAAAKEELDQLDFGVKQILEGFVEPKLTPEDAPMVSGWGRSTIEYLVEKIRNRKKNEPSTN